MTGKGLKFINDVIVAAGIHYEFLEYTSSLEDISTYWVGEYNEEEPYTEDGLSETQFILTGTGKEFWKDLEREREIIKNLFPDARGKTAILDDGSGIAVFYCNAFPVPTGDGFLKRLQINLKVKEWEVE